MRKPSIFSKALSRRQFIGGAAAATVLAGTGACTSPSTRVAEFRYRLGLSQPPDSPNYIRLKEMAERIHADTGGRMQVDLFPESKLGNDSVMLAMLQKGELEMYMGGNVFGLRVPVTEMPGLPFTFKNSADVFAALDGALGDHIRVEMASKGLHAFRFGFDNGFHQLTTRTRPIRTVDDLVGMTIRTPVQKMTVDFFESLGAKPMTFTLNRLYEVLKDHTVDGQTDPLQIIVLLKLNEVQTYLSLTNHWWSGFTLTANPQAWRELPPDIQAAVNRHAESAALAQRQDVARLDAGAVELLRSRGMIVNTADTSGFRNHLGAFYARWKGIYGDRAWALLEARVGKLA
jgi:tripartite ATP-independent transporter DctP family solute receptor